MKNSYCQVSAPFKTVNVIIDLQNDFGGWTVSGYIRPKDPKKKAKYHFLSGPWSSAGHRFEYQVRWCPKKQQWTPPKQILGH